MLKWVVLLFLILLFALSTFTLTTNNNQNISVQKTITGEKIVTEANPTPPEDEDAIAALVAMCRMLFGIGMEATDYVAEMPMNAPKESIDIWRQWYVGN